MPKRLTDVLVARYRRDGLHFPLPVLSADLDKAGLAAHREAVDRSAKALYHGTSRAQFRA